MSNAQPENAGAPVGKRRRRRRLLFVAFALAMVALVLEGGGVIAWWATTGELFTWQRAAAARALAHSDKALPATPDSRDQAVQWVAAHGVMVHPYLGFVHDGSHDQVAAFPTSEFGFYGTASPLRQRDANRYIVGIVGGSVALQLGLYAEDRLIAALRRSPTLAQREIEVVNLALGGFKQPQQLLTVELLLALGGEFDCIVNLDGFNEVALLQENLPAGVPAWYPRSWARLLDAVPTPEQQRRLGHIAVLLEERQQRADGAEAVWWSPLLQFVWYWRDRDLLGRLGSLRSAAERAAATPSAAVTGPGTGGLSVAEARIEMTKLWRRTSLQLHAVCESHGIRYLHFLQPNQYVPGSKPIGEQEATVAVDLDHPWRPAVLAGYPLLQREGATLVASGVDFTDLTAVFAGHPEPLYTDTCCHFGRQGHAVVAEHIAAAIRRRLDLAGVEWRGLRVSPERFELTSPLGGPPLAVVGIDADGGEHDLSGAGFGTEIDAIPAGQVVVAADGTVRAVRRGEAVLRVRQGAATTEVAVSANWPDVFEASDGIAAGDGGVPRLLLDPDQVAAGAATATVVINGMPAAPFRFVATAPRPLPESPKGAEQFGLSLMPVASAADSASVTVAIAAPPGQPMFVRFYALAANATDVVAASNTIVITRD